MFLDQDLDRQSFDLILEFGADSDAQNGDDFRAVGDDQHNTHGHQDDPVTDNKSVLRAEIVPIGIHIPFLYQDNNLVFWRASITKLMWYREMPTASEYGLLEAEDFILSCP